MEALRLLNSFAAESKYIVFFGGAGVSTESGIPDFRSADGLYGGKYCNLSPEEILSHTFFTRYTEDFYKFYREKMLFPNALPNAAHKKLAELENLGKLKAVITQNIDGLHQKAGSKNVLELHGSVYRNFCTLCGKSYGIDAIINSPASAPAIPRCDCGGIIKPDVVLYEEPLDPRVSEAALTHIRNADMLIVGGTSLAVYPAAGLVRHSKGKIVLINKSETPFDNAADLIIRENIGNVMANININK